MCGFLCIIRKEKVNEIPKHNSIPENLLHHRGPDFTSEVQYENFQIRHWRLSIVDLSDASNQPINDNKYIFVYNGEIYDYKNIVNRLGLDINSDTWAVRSLLDTSDGVNELYSLPGFFSYLLISKERKTVLGSRDIFGKKPLYYFIDDNLAIFSSEEKAILPFISSKSINKESLKEYFLYKDVFFGKSFYKGINEIPPGSNFLFDERKWEMTISKSWGDYYNCDFSENFSNLKEEQKAEEIKNNWLKNEINNAVTRRLTSDVPVQIGLSGGLDSTLITALAAGSNFYHSINRAINVSFKQGVDESAEAKITSKSLGLNFAKVNFQTDDFVELMKSAVKYFDGPLSHPHSLAVYQICREASNSGKVLITGEGADELFYGYDHYIKFNNNSFAFREYLTVREEYLYYNDKSSSKHPFDDIRNNSIKDLRKKAIQSEYQSRDLEIKTHLLSLLKRNDRMGMAHSIEIRCPYLDYNLFQYMYGQDQSDLAFNQKFYLEEILKDVNPKLSKNRKKNGFIIPFDENFNEISNCYETKKWIGIACDYISENYRLSLKDKEKLTPRLGWTLMNIGCFLESF